MGKSGRRIRNPQLHAKEEKPFFGAKTKTADTGVFFQAKGLAVGKPGDKFEKEADTVANSVVNAGQSGGVIQEKEISAVQRESLSTPLEDEKLGTAEQRMEEDKLIQEQPEEEEETMQRMEMENENENENEEKEELQMKVQSDPAPKCASTQVASKIKAESGKGKPMSGKVKKDMEKAFGVDFSDVNIHTGENAEKLTKKMKAQAFTYGKDIYFNSGKFNPEHASGKKLLAHELTHVVQQKQAKKKDK